MCVCACVCICVNVSFLSPFSLSRLCTLARIHVLSLRVRGVCFGAAVDV